MASIHSVFVILLLTATMTTLCKSEEKESADYFDERELDEDSVHLNEVSGRLYN